MHILITGANGFIGRHLVKKLLAESCLLSPSRITVMDLVLDQIPDNPLVKKVSGSFTELELLAAAMNETVDLVFHLASVPSGLAENNYALGVEVNVHGTMALLEKLKDQDNKPTMVFASSIAVFGKPPLPEVNDDTSPTPNLSYGGQKVIGETLVADFIRRGWIKGCSVRLPGIVARPPEPNGAISIFFSDLIRNLSNGEAFTCPVSPQAKSWLMSVACCVDNLLHAATLEQNTRRTWTLPAMHVSIEDLVATIDEQTSSHDVLSLISYDPDPWVEENFGSYPPLNCPEAELAGFHHDGSLQLLVNNSLEGL
ncbi:MAG: NAD-dependent epimerase/dehydratase family protein [Gammaproteobacteria bacterium]|nr:NAD-dependent epimerase/dehydratase family protein [Gammaproteobacteria bacterium]